MEMQNQQLRQHAPAFLPNSERGRVGMQLELQEDQPLDVREFMNQSDQEDRDKDIDGDDF